MSSPWTTALLERTAEQVIVLAPPVEPMLAEADRLRRRRRTAVGGAVLAVLVTLGAADVVRSFVDPDPKAWPAAAPPDGMRFVGVGRSVIAVPSGWATDATRCGQPVRDTVVLAPGPEDPCRAERPAGVRSVVVREGEVEGFHAVATYRVGGRPVERSALRCAEGTCSTMVRLPSENVTFTVASSAGTEALARAEVVAIAFTARVLDGHTAVPATRMLAAEYGRSAEAKYVAELRTLGLDPVVVPAATTTGADPGTVIGVSPEPGTPLEAGSEVRVRVAGGERAPQDEVAVGIGIVDEDRHYGGLTQEDIRRGTTLEVSQGTDLWAFADGRRSRTLEARQEGDSIVLDFWRNGPDYPTTWEAVHPGTTELTLSIRVDGRRVDLGTVRIVVTE